MKFSPEGKRNHDACLQILSRMTPEQLTPGKRHENYDHASDALDQRFKPKPRTETSTLHQNSYKEAPVFERDNEAAAKLREWDNEER